jgi:hypothetical protein
MEVYMRIETIIENVKITQKTTYRNLTMFALRGGVVESRGYLTLVEALERDLATVREVSAEGRVPELLFDNLAEVPVLIVDGEELVGAKQNRTANLTILAPPRSKIVIPVSCVEAGRWRRESDDLRVSKRVHFVRGRAAKMESVSYSIGHGGSRRSDQSRVWSDIAETAQDMGATSPTRAMAAIFDRHQSSIEDFVEAFGPTHRQTGALFSIGGKSFSLDLFDHPKTLRLMLPKLVRSNAVDAIGDRAGPGRAPRRRAAAAFLNAVGGVEHRVFAAVGMGSDIRAAGDGLVAGGLIHDERLIHLAAFAIFEEPSSFSG